MWKIPHISSYNSSFVREKQYQLKFQFIWKVTKGKKTWPIYNSELQYHEINNIQKIQTE
jgi:hypothetical protein